jgi:hypothetical protein
MFEVVLLIQILESGLYRGNVVADRRQEPPRPGSSFRKDRGRALLLAALPSPLSPSISLSALLSHVAMVARPSRERHSRCILLPPPCQLAPTCSFTCCVAPQRLLPLAVARPSLTVGRHAGACPPPTAVVERLGATADQG